MDIFLNKKLIDISVSTKVGLFQEVVLWHINIHVFNCEGFKICFITSIFIQDFSRPYVNVKNQSYVYEVLVIRIEFLRTSVRNKLKNSFASLLRWFTWFWITGNNLALSPILGNLGHVGNIKMSSKFPFCLAYFYSLVLKFEICSGFLWNAFF